MRVHHLPGTEIVVMVLCIMASLAVMEAVIFVFGPGLTKVTGVTGNPARRRAAAMRRMTIAGPHLASILSGFARAIAQLGLGHGRNAESIAVPPRKAKIFHRVAT